MEDPTKYESRELWIRIIDREPKKIYWMTNSFGIDEDWYLKIIYTFKIYIDEEEDTEIPIFIDLKERGQSSA